MKKKEELKVFFLPPTKWTKAEADTGESSKTFLN